MVFRFSLGGDGVASLGINNPPSQTSENEEFTQLAIKVGAIVVVPSSTRPAFIRQVFIMCAASKSRVIVIWPIDSPKAKKLNILPPNFLDAKKISLLTFSVWTNFFPNFLGAENFVSQLLGRKKIVSQLLGCEKVSLPTSWVRKFFVSQLLGCGNFSPIFLGSELLFS